MNSTELMMPRLRVALVSMSITLMVSAPAGADDTEIFVGQYVDPGAPNVMLMIDNSGSMGALVSAPIPYDSSKTYEGDCVAGRIYFDRSGNLPDCSTTSNWIDEASLTCESARYWLDNFGGYRDRIARWDEVPGNPGISYWRGLSANVPAQLVECNSDWGWHGRNTGDGVVFPADGNSGPWTNDVWDWNLINWWWYNSYSLFTANYINYENSPDAVVKTRLDVVKEVATELLAKTSGINVGLSIFDFDEGGPVRYALTPVDQARAELTAIIQGLAPTTWTPLAETLYEVGQYYAGRSVDYGLYSSPSSTAASRSGNTYISPIVNECQKNYVVLLTDGEATLDDGANSRVPNLPGFFGATGLSACAGNCLEEMAEYMFKGDLRSDMANDQQASTYTIGFQIDGGFLADTASRGGGQYYNANDADELTKAFDNIIDDILTRDVSFSPPTIALNNFNRLNHRSDLYFNLFRPVNHPHWEGNLKHYRLGNVTDEGIQIMDANNSPALDPATNLFFNTAKSFWTDGDADGADVTKGGFRSRLGADRNVYTMTGSNVELTAAENRVHEDNDYLTAELLQIIGAGGSDASWTFCGNEWTQCNFSGSKEVRYGKNSSWFTGTYTNGVECTNAVFGDPVPGVYKECQYRDLSASVGRDDLIRWARGVDSNGDALNILGDGLHGTPVVVTYGGSNTNPDLALYYGTNDGYVHAVDPTAMANENMELFSFIPKEMLPHLKTVSDTNTGGGQKGYGIDGAMIHWIKGDDGDGVVETGEQAIVAFGMRRGGRNYYAMDVSDRTAPKMLWTIHGGSGSFSELGQTWSTPVRSKVLYNDSARDVLFFSGGYDVGQDAAAAPRDDTMGRALYMVDAHTGALLWSAANADIGNANLKLSQMTNALPSTPAVLDLNGDSKADRIYVGDTRGQIWRFDINATNTGASNFATGGIFASLGDSGAANNRRVFYAPSVSLISDKEHGTFLTVSVGSGHRPNPLGSAVNDRFYMLRDPYVFGPKTDSAGTPVYTPITEGDLLDVTSNLAPSTDDLNANDGWMIDLRDGEKVLAAPLTADRRVFFTTYTPGSLSTLSCEPSGAVGEAKLYAVDLVSGGPRLEPEQFPDNPEYDPDNPNAGLGDAVCGGRCTETAGPIPPSPTLVFTDPDDTGDPADDDDGDGDEDACSSLSNVNLLVGTRVHNPNICTSPVLTYWVNQGEE